MDAESLIPPGEDWRPVLRGVPVGPLMSSLVSGVTLEISSQFSY